MRILALAAALALPAPCLASGTFTVLHKFTDIPDGRVPGYDIVIDRAGELFGVTQGGGAHGSGYGAFFRLTPPSSGQTSWTETILYSFTRQPYGYLPNLITGGPPGHFFVTTSLAAPPRGFCSVVLDFSQHGKVWKPEIVWAFGTGTDSCTIPTYSPPVLDRTGGLLVETSDGGPDDAGTIIKLTPPVSGSTAWTETVLWAFSKQADYSPNGELVLDPAGNIFGTSMLGGTQNAGAVWELSPPASGGGSWTHTVLYNFANSPTDGRQPEASLLRDTAGDLYGFAYNGTTDLNSLLWELSRPASTGSAWTEKLIDDLNGSIYGLGLDRKGNVIATTGGGLREFTPPAAGQTSWTKRLLQAWSRYYTPNEPLSASGSRVFGTFQSGFGQFGSVWEWRP